MNEYEYEGREPKTAVEMEITLTAKLYEIESDDHGLEARPIVVTDGDTETASVDAAEAAREWVGWPLQMKLKRELQERLE